MLDESPIWKQYKDQKMDLFLADKPRFAIEASPGQTNLYLTQVRLESRMTTRDKRYQFLT